MSDMLQKLGLLIPSVSASAHPRRRSSPTSAPSANESLRNYATYSNTCVHTQVTATPFSLFFIQGKVREIQGQEKGREFNYSCQNVAY